MIYGSQLQHTCWIYSFFSPRLAQGQVRVPFSAAHPHRHALCGSLWWTALRKASVFQNELSAIYRWPQWLSDSISGAQGGAGWKPVIRSALKWCTLPVILFIHLPPQHFHHLISHICLSPSSYVETQTERGTAVGFLRPLNSCKPCMALHLFKSHSITVCISTKASYITVHRGVLSGLTLLTSEQMEIICYGERPENGLASISLSQAGSLKWDNLNKATWEESGLGCGFIWCGTMNTTKSLWIFINYSDDLLCLGASDAVSLPLQGARRNKWSAH